MFADWTCNSTIEFGTLSSDTRSFQIRYRSHIIKHMFFNIGYLYSQLHHPEESANADTKEREIVGIQEFSFRQPLSRHLPRVPCEDGETSY